MSASVPEPGDRVRLKADTSRFERVWTVTEVSPQGGTIRICREGRTPSIYACMYVTASNLIPASQETPTP